MSSIKLAFAALIGEGNWLFAASTRGLTPVRDGVVPAKSDTAVLVVPGSAVLARWIEVPGGTPAQQRAAALLKLAPELASSAGECVVALGPASGAKRMVCVASVGDVKQWIAAAHAKGFEPGIVTVDFALLPVPQDNRLMVARIGEDALVRGPERAFACQSDLLDTLLRGEPANSVEFETAIADQLRPAPLAALPDFLPAMPAASASLAASGWLMRTGVFAGIALALFALAPWVKAVRLGADTAALRSSASAVATKALPRAARVVNPRAQLKEALLGYGDNGALLGAVEGFLGAVAPLPLIEVSRLEADAANGVRASISASTAEDLVALREALLASGFDMQETPGPAKSGRVQFELVVRARP